MKIIHILTFLVVILQGFFYQELNGQILNGDFSSSTIGCNNNPAHWTSNNNIQFADYYQPGNNWMDITGCGFGNGNWIEQEVRTTPGMYYQIQLDIGTWWGWDIEDAGVDVTIDGIPLGARCFNDSFTKSFIINLHWEAVTTCYFKAKGNSTVIRFTGHGKCSKFSPPSACNNPSPGVIAIDNIHFSDSFNQQKIYNLCAGESLKIGHKVYNNAGDFLDTQESWKSCQTVIPFHINMHKRSYASQIFYLCDGDTIKVGSHVYNSSGTYADTIQNYQGCDSIISTQIVIYDVANHYVSENICLGDSILFNQKFYTEPGIYSDTFSSYHGCDSIVNLTLNFLPLQVCQCHKLEKIPNVFSPDNDHINDLFPDVYVQDMTLSIYDRWGILVYYSDNGSGWDGSMCGREFASGTYFYFIDYSNCKNESISTHGVITLIR